MWQKLNSLVAIIQAASLLIDAPETEMAPVTAGRFTRSCWITVVCASRVGVHVSTRVVTAGVHSIAHKAQSCSAGVRSQEERTWWDRRASGSVLRAADRRVDDVVINTIYGKMGRGQTVATTMVRYT